MVTDPGLVAGCCVGGVVAGIALDAVVVRVRPPAPVPPVHPLGPTLPVSGTLDTLGAPLPADLPAQGIDQDHEAAPGHGGPVRAQGETPDATAPPEGAPRPAGTPAGRVVAPVVTGALLGLAAAVLGPIDALGAVCVLLAGLVALSSADLRVGLVPRKILYPVLALTAAGFVGAAVGGGSWRALGDAAIGGVGALAFFFLVWWFYPRGMGFGDVRLAGLVGVGLGWFGLLHVYVGLLVAFVTGALAGLVIMVLRGTGRSTRLPFAPALSLGAAVGMLWGSDLIHAWLPSLH